MQPEVREVRGLIMAEDSEDSAHGASLMPLRDKKFARGASAMPSSVVKQLDAVGLHCHELRGFDTIPCGFDTILSRNQHEIREPTEQPPSLALPLLLGELDGAKELQSGFAGARCEIVPVSAEPRSRSISRWPNELLYTFAIPSRSEELTAARTR